MEKERIIQPANPESVQRVWEIATELVDTYGVPENIELESFKAQPASEQWLEISRSVSHPKKVDIEIGKVHPDKLKNVRRFEINNDPKDIVHILLEEQEAQNLMALLRNVKIQKEAGQL
jgi:hypothetical protein